MQRYFKDVSRKPKRLNELTTESTLSLFILNFRYKDLHQRTLSYWLTLRHNTFTLLLGLPYQKDKHVSRKFDECWLEVLRVCPGSSKGRCKEELELLLETFKGASRVSKRSSKAVSRQFQSSFKDILSKFQGWKKKVLSVFQENLKKSKGHLKNVSMKFCSYPSRRRAYF